MYELKPIYLQLQRLLFGGPDIDITTSCSPTTFGAIMSRFWRSKSRCFKEAGISSPIQDFGRRVPQQISKCVLDNWTGDGDMLDTPENRAIAIYCIGDVILTKSEPNSLSSMWLGEVGLQVLHTHKCSCLCHAV